MKSNKMTNGSVWYNWIWRAMSTSDGRFSFRVLLRSLDLVTHVNRALKRRRIKKKEAFKYKFPNKTERQIELLLTAFRQLKEIEPALQSFVDEDIRIMDCYSPIVVKPNYCITLKRFLDSIDHAYDRIIFVPWLKFGGADLLAVYATYAAQIAHGDDSVLMLVADYDRIPAREWLRENTHVRVLSEFDPSLTHVDRVELIKAIIHHLRPKSVLNINSHACWETIFRYGTALSLHTELYAMLFCYEHTTDGCQRGYATDYFRHCIGHITKLYSDNAHFLSHLADKYGLYQDLRKKLVPLYQPHGLPYQTSVAKRPRSFRRGERLRVFWAGRICRQKNPLLLIEIGKSCPDITFDVYGVCDPEFQNAFQNNLSANMSYKGPYRGFNSLPIEEYHVYLYTSLWDGLPNVLISAGLFGLPVVACGLEGIMELVDKTTGWPVEQYEQSDGYIDALREIQENPDEANLRGTALQHLVMTRHSWEAYMSAFSSPPSFLS